MTSPVPLYHKETLAPCLLALLALMLITCGCTQPASYQQLPTLATQQPVQQQQGAPAPVTITRPDNSHMTIAYPGSRDTDTLLELEITVTDSLGKTQTKSMGSRLSTTPLKYGATLTLTGTFTGNEHVVVTGYFMDSSQKLMLDTIL